MHEKLTIHNHGPLIRATNFFDSPMARAGMLYLSINDGCFRLLVPDCLRSSVSDMRIGAKHVAITALSSEGWVDGEYAIEWMIEDGTDSPWSCHLSTGQIDRALGAADVGRQWIASVWARKKGRPHKCLERPAYLRFADRLPYLGRIGS